MKNKSVQEWAYNFAVLGVSLSLADTVLLISSRTRGPSDVFAIHRMYAATAI